MRPRHHAQADGRKRCTRACDSCKRRKERCDGRQPCVRCIKRAVQTECRFDTLHGRRDGKIRLEGSRQSQGDACASDFFARSPAAFACFPSPMAVGKAMSKAAAMGQPRLLLAEQARALYLGDSANSSFLESIRRLVRATQGPCALGNDPLCPGVVEAMPEDAQAWLDAGNESDMPPVLSEQEVTRLIRRYHLCTNGVLDLFDSATILHQLPRTIAQDVAKVPLTKPVIYLIMAIGAQASPQQDLNEVSEAYFRRGRYLSARHLMENTSLATVEAYLLITMYLLSASRRNTAFMHLGIAVRAAYALGLHSQPLSDSVSAEEAHRRDRIWKSVRSLDVLSSAMLGRPPSTKATHNTTSPEGCHSACTDLVAIMDDVLTNVYEQREISAVVLTRVASRQREWATVYTRGLKADNIEPEDSNQTSDMPNIGLIHLKIVFHWTVMLLTRPFLSERVAAHARQIPAGTHNAPSSWTPPGPSRVLAHACVNSAIRTLALLKPLLSCKDVPRCLPFSIGCVVHSALVLSLAYFGDMDQTFPLDRFLDTSRHLLQYFAADAVASRGLEVLRHLHNSCQRYAQGRHAADAQLVSSLSGPFDYPSHEGDAQQQTAPIIGSTDITDSLFHLKNTLQSWDSVSRYGIQSTVGGTAGGSAALLPPSPSSMPSMMPVSDDTDMAQMQLPSGMETSIDVSNLANLAYQDDFFSLYFSMDSAGSFVL